MVESGAIGTGPTRRQRRGQLWFRWGRNRSL